MLIKGRTNSGAGAPSSSPSETRVPAPRALIARAKAVQGVLQRARRDHQKSLERVGKLLDRAIAQAEDERRAETLSGLLKDARLELVRLEDAHRPKADERFWIGL